MKGSIRVGVLLVAGVLAEATWVSGANADVILTYTGNDFAHFSSGYYTSSDSITGTIDLAAPLADNLSLASVTPTSFSFSDGVQSITQANLFAPAPTFEFSTNASGVITAWDISLALAPSSTNAIYTYDHGGTDHNDAAYDGTSGSGQSVVPGTWSVQSTATSVPEPLTLSLFGAGLVGAAAMRRRKAKH